ncbi:hypothetical protein HK097_006559 [Rhizophlyctis rosea]|uniref:Mitochondrial import inner membrane translocase subunit Tim21 n=1 Tax=Rhizophlyctis rosea TaxID=64517 RepID=A0AAD5X5Q1_9FUNG|nr:hypothetical protein HK097_006559 [Rhizophlyctis rosea]
MLPLLRTRTATTRFSHLTSSSLYLHPSVRSLTIGRIDHTTATDNSQTTASTPPPKNDDAAAKAQAARKRAWAREHGRIGWDDLTFGEKFRHGLKTMGYTGFVLLGLGVLGSALYYVSLELIGDTTAWRLHDEALERVLNSEAVQRAVGIPITTHGEDGRGARKGKVLSHQITEEDGKRMCSMRFFIEGPKDRGTVQLEMFENKETGQWEYHVLFVDLPDSYAVRQRIFVVDNREVIMMGRKKKTGWFGVGSGGLASLKRD